MSSLLAIKVAVAAFGTDKNQIYGCFKLMNVISLIQSPAAIPDNAFSERTYLLGSLYVPGGTMARYMVRDGWKNFTYMEETDLPTGISNVSTDVQEVTRYTIDGKRVSQTQRGLNILRMSNGKTKKVVVK